MVAVLAVFVAAAFGKAGEPHTNYGFIIDAGSGGSRIHLYSWAPRVFEVLPPPYTFPQTNKEWQFKIKPGISSFSSNPVAAGQSLAPLIKFGAGLLQKLGVERRKLAAVPVFLKATAGMREMNDVALKNKILHEVRMFLLDKQECPFYFQWWQARVISGEEEGVYAWITVNYILGNLEHAGEGGVGTAAPNSTLMAGSLDMGGNSLQIAFFRPMQDIMEDLYKVQIGSNRHWNVYVHSFLHFGHREAWQRLKSPPWKPASCDSNGLRFPKPSATTNSTTSNSDESSADGGHHSNPFFTKISTATAANPAIGTLCQHPTNFTACHAAAQTLLLKENNAWCHYSHNTSCSFAGVYQPPLAGKFYAMSGFADTYEAYGLHANDDLGVLQEKAEKVCRMTSDQARDFLDRPKNKYLEEACFMASYVIAVLKDGFGFPLKDTPLTVGNELDGFVLDYTLGAMIYEVNNQPYSLMIPPTTFNANNQPIPPSQWRVLDKQHDQDEHVTSLTAVRSASGSNDGSGGSKSGNSEVERWQYRACLAAVAAAVATLAAMTVAVRCYRQQQLLQRLQRQLQQDSSSSSSNRDYSSTYGSISASQPPTAGMSVRAFEFWARLKEMGASSKPLQVQLVPSTSTEPGEANTRIQIQTDSQAASGDRRQGQYASL